MRADPSSEPKDRAQSPLREIVTNSADETFAVSKGIGESLTGGEVFLLTGDLGAGKTVFAKGIAAGLGIAPAEVTSPTFTLINLYQGRLRLYHIDLYRLEVGVHDELGMNEILDEKEAVVVIEWAERLGFVHDDATYVEMSWLSENQRKITIG